MNDNKKIAYFSAEIGLSSDIPTYSGGLGVLAGDHIKASADNGLNMVAITLLYKEGYFKQEIDDQGLQKEFYPSFDYDKYFELLPKQVSIKLRGRNILINVYKYIYFGEKKHSIPIYFLDTNIPENHEDDQKITLRLYSGDSDHRVLQESILGFGGIRLLEELGHTNIHKYHMNEGHCSFLTLELLRKYNNNEQLVKEKCHFTTHTPVPAGHDQFQISNCQKILGDLLPTDLNLESLKNENILHMTELGLNFSSSANGVSKLHGDVAQKQFPNYNINFITNGVHHISWLGEDYKSLYDNKLSGWRQNPDLLLDLNGIQDIELIDAHQLQKEKLLKEINSNINNKFSSEILTIGFARRSAEYKRARLIFYDIDKLIDASDSHIQIVFSGKAHPNDLGGKEIIKDIYKTSKNLKDKISICFLENYNMRLGKLITSGVDVWLNTPLRPNEASGTSGMKAALNGIPNFSILDGWWAEACIDGNNGWSIGSPDYCNDKADSDSLYRRLKNEIIPLYYDNKKNWCQIMRSSINTSVDYTAHRMIQDYNNKYYK